jgi:DNA-binding NarL/FixJ family response regulator
MIRVLVVDDRIDFRLAFCGLLEADPDLKVVSQAGSLAEARTMLEGVDVALLDRGLPDGDGLELVGPLRAVNPGARVFVISSTVEMLHPKDAIRAGAEGVIDKLDTPARVFQAIRGGGQGSEEAIQPSAWKAFSRKFAICRGIGMPSVPYQFTEDSSSGATLSAGWVYLASGSFSFPESPVGAPWAHPLTLGLFTWVLKGSFLRTTSR